MATQQIKWLPNNAPSIVAYELLVSDKGSAGPYTKLTQVLHSIPGLNWDSAGSFFFYNDGLIPHRFYKLATLDQFGNREEGNAATPFQAGNDPVIAPVLTSMAMDEHTGGLDNLQYVTEGGTPVEGARIRVYVKLDWDTKALSNAIGTTVTKADGGWSEPVFVTPGQTYTVVYNKTYAFGPDTREITV